MIESPAFPQDVLRIPLGNGVAAAEHEAGIFVAQRIGEAGALCLLAVKLICYRHHIFDNGLTEAVNILFAVAVTVHAVISQGDIVVVSQLPAHAGAQSGELIIDIVQFLLVGIKEGVVGFPGFVAQCIIGRLHIRRKLAQSQHLPLKGDLGGGDELVIGGDQLVLLLHVGNELFVKGPQLDTQVGEQQFTVFFGELRPELTVVQGLVELCIQLLEQGHHFIQHFLFLGIKGIFCVDGVTNGDQGHSRGDPVSHVAVLVESSVRLGEIGGVDKGLHIGSAFLPDLLKIRADVRHFRKLHMRVPPCGFFLIIHGNTPACIPSRGIYPKFYVL